MPQRFRNISVKPAAYSGLSQAEWGAWGVGDLPVFGRKVNPIKMTWIPLALSQPGGQGALLRALRIFRPCDGSDNKMILTQRSDTTHFRRVSE